MSEKERIYWQENSLGRIFFSSPASPIHPGYMLKSTTNPKEMDRLFRKMHDQEREHNEKFIEKLYNQGREFYNRRRSALIQRLGSAGVSEAEKAIIREALKLMDEKDHEAQKNGVYGVSAMEESPAPLPPGNTRIM